VQTLSRAQRRFMQRCRTTGHRWLWRPAQKRVIIAVRELMAHKAQWFSRATPNCLDCHSEPLVITT